MTKQKRKKNKLIFIILTLIFCQSHNSLLYSNELKCKKFDIKCKTNKFIEKTKVYQKKEFEEVKSQIDSTKDKIKDIVPKKK
tara:strand:+ start:200 stop:445 length:246 start_codon:yes stop_codon:yes gene_type:complete